MADKSGKFTDEWGRSVARGRYGAPKPGSMKAAEGQDLPEQPADKQGPKYDNNTPSNWLRGMPSAENKPSFDHVGKNPKGK